MRTLTILIAAISLLFLPACNNEHAQDEKDLAKLAESLDDFNNHSNGEGVAGIFSKNTFELYDRLLKVGLNGTAQQVRALPPAEQFEVLLMRIKGSRAEVAKLDGRGYVVYGTSKGWYITAFEDRTTDTLKHFKFSDTDATADLYSDGEKSGLRMRFVKEDGVWKIDETYFYDSLSAFITKNSREAGISVEEFLTLVLDDHLKGQVPDNPWQPMK